MPILSCGVSMLQAKSYIRKKIHVSGNEYYYIHIPSKLAHDSQFPFRDGDELRIAVDVSRIKVYNGSECIRRVYKGSLKKRFAVNTKQAAFIDYLLRRFMMVRG